MFTLITRWFITNNAVAEKNIDEFITLKSKSYSTWCTLDFYLFYNGKGSCFKLLTSNVFLYEFFFPCMNASVYIHVALKESYV